MPELMLLWNEQEQELEVPVDQTAFLYFRRAQQVTDGTATVHDSSSRTDYTIPDGEEVCRVATEGLAGRRLRLAFVKRSNDNIHFVQVETGSRREVAKADERALPVRAARVKSAAKRGNPPAAAEEASAKRPRKEDRD